MKQQSRTVPRRRQSVSPTPRHLPLVDILIDTQAELQELVVASGLKVTARYLGVNIHAVKPLLNARVRFSDTLSVVQWGLYSAGLSDSETQSFLSELPKGNLLNPFLTPPLPDLSAETSTTLTMLALAADEECRGRDPYWVEVTTSQGDVYHINPNVTQIREFPSLFLEAHWAMVVAYLVYL